jgi:hypothetical protein
MFAGHFGDNNLEQQLLALIFGRILILLKHQLQCISVYAIAYSCLGFTTGTGNGGSGAGVEDTDSWAEAEDTGSGVGTEI